MKDKIITFLGILFLVSVLLLIMKCQNSFKHEHTHVDIENTAAVKEEIKGKWSCTFTDLGTTWYYRFEITDNQIKYWTRFGEWEWKTEPEAVLSYELTGIIRDTYGKKLRGLSTDEVNLGLKRGGGLTFEDGCLTFNGGCLYKGWE